MLKLEKVALLAADSCCSSPVFNLKCEVKETMARIRCDVFRDGFLVRHFNSAVTEDFTDDGAQANDIGGSHGSIA